MFCTKCGMKLNDGETICPQCGYVRQQAELQQPSQQGVAQQQNQQGVMQQSSQQGVTQQLNQQGYAQQQNQQAELQQPSQQGITQQPNRQGYVPNRVEIGNTVKVFSQFSNMQLFGFGGCLLMFISMFLEFVYARYGSERESVTMWKLFSEGYESPFWGFVTLIVIGIAAVFCYRNELKKAVVCGLIAMLPPFFGWALMPTGDSGIVVHFAFGAYLFLVGFVLIAVACYKNEKDSNELGNSVVNRSNYYK